MLEAKIKVEKEKVREKIKNMSKWEELEASLWGLYYHEKNDEMKKYVYQTIKEINSKALPLTRRLAYM